MENRKKVMLATVILKNVDSQVYASHMSFAYRCGRECTDYDFWIATPQRWAIDSARNVLVMQAIRWKMDYLFFYDDDTWLVPNSMKQLLEAMENNPEVHVLSGHYYVRGYPFPLMAFVQDEEVKEKWRNITKEEETVLLKKNGLIGPLKAVGNGCTLYRVEIFEKIDPHIPLEKRIWFQTRIHQYTEDVHFFAKAFSQLDNLGVYMHPNVVMGHELAEKDFVDKTNVDILRERWDKEIGHSITTEDRS